MIHGPCGSYNRSSPCMKDGKCSRYFPKKFSQTTVVDEDGYPFYRIRDNENVVDKNGISLDNRYVVPYNPSLLTKYQAHINMKWCNQSTSIKYLFKYINKWYDRITAVIESTENGGSLNERNIDELKQYLDGRYISPSKASWRIFGFPIHGRQPAVEILYFHLPGEHPVYFNDNDEIDNILSRPTRNRRSLRDYPPMPYPKGYITSQLGKKLIYDELNYDTTELKDNFNLLFQSLTDEQCKIFKIVMEAVNQEQ
ncbi:hypothetical protein Lal_00002215 [Lupinus albus]|nr:hypothetical protein Lal_00002215 [Lupinus albus]